MKKASNDDTSNSDLGVTAKTMSMQEALALNRISLNRKGEFSINVHYSALYYHDLPQTSVDQHMLRM